ncbi:shikimate kinase [Citricoccus sp. GCM10030269]|uniref:shikimate kinase n=1 Tax=Citricoccus sp. GCM10030269 TaxID=3273388 RepID=UPI00361DEFC9
MSPRLALIGPAAAGKSTVGERVAQHFDCQFIDLDEVADSFYAEVGWSIERLADEAAKIGRYEAEIAWEPARIHAVRRAMDSYDGAILALGAGHTSYTSPSRQRDIASLLDRVPHVVYVEPFPDRTESLRELRRRSLHSKGTKWISGGHDFLAEWLSDPHMRTLADHGVYTDSASVQDLADEIASLAMGARSRHEKTRNT